MVTINEAAASLSKHLRPWPDPNHWLGGVGIGPGELHVMLQTRPWKDVIPTSWEGYPVKVLFVGKLRLCGGDDGGSIQAGGP